ncbi:MAG: hypothetical protein OXE99_02595 [Cellvibrionales bacterium]|nr:hypothetical protein [Cellvibrionales bacterium]
MIGPSGIDQEDDMPMIEIFGGLFAVLLVLFIIITLLSSYQEATRLEETPDPGEFTIGFQGEGEGHVVIASSDGIFIPALGERIDSRHICARGSPFIDFSKAIYLKRKQQIIFAIVSGGVSSMATARNCLRTTLFGQRLTIGWIIADDELLKSLSLNQLPDYIKHAVDAK